MIIFYSGGSGKETLPENSLDEAAIMLTFWSSFGTRKGIEPRLADIVEARSSDDHLLRGSESVKA